MVRVKDHRSGTPGSSRPLRDSTVFCCCFFSSFKIEETCTLTTFVEQKLSICVNKLRNFMWVSVNRERAVCDMETSLYRKQVLTSKDCKQQRLRDSKLAQCICCKRFYLFLCERSAHETWHIVTAVIYCYISTDFHYAKTWLWLPFSIKAYLITFFA